MTGSDGSLDKAEEDPRNQVNDGVKIDQRILQGPIFEEDGTKGWLSQLC